jgi:hypothetical protein
LKVTLNLPTMAKAITCLPYAWLTASVYNI